MRFLLDFIFGASYLGNRVFRVAFFLLILFMVFCLYQMSKPLGHNRRLLHRHLTAVDPVDFVSGGGRSVVPQPSLSQRLKQLKSSAVNEIAARGRPRLRSPLEQGFQDLLCSFDDRR